MRPRVLWVHNFPTHYTAGLFAAMGAELDVEFLFYSRGGEWYWLRENGLPACRFRHRYLRGLTIGGTRVAPGLVWRLWREDYDVAAAGVDGKFALPVTYLMARLRGRPFLLYTGIWTRVGTLTHRLAFPLLRHIYRHADGVVVYGEHVKRYLLGEGVREERILVEPHAVDNGFYGRAVEKGELVGVRRRLGTGTETPLVLFTGRLEAEKGLTVLLRAFARCGEGRAVLVLAGSGSAEGELRALAGQLGIAERVRWTGYLRQEETRAFYAAATVFVLPSVTTRNGKEAWGLVVNEAFNQGLPVIATDATGAAAGGLVEDGVTGWVVPERDVEAMAGALGSALGDAAERARRGAAARERVGEWSQENAARVIARAVRGGVDWGNGAGMADAVEGMRVTGRVVRDGVVGGNAVALSGGAEGMRVTGRAVRGGVDLGNGAGMADAVEGMRVTGRVVRDGVVLERDEAVMAGARGRADQPDAGARIWVVIPVHNRAAFTRGCLEALRGQSVPADGIVVVDDGSTDGTPEMVAREFPDVVLLRGDGELWWTGATNLGVREALRRGATHILTLNDDTVPTAEFLERMATAAREEPGALIGAWAVDAVTGEPVQTGERVRWVTATHAPQRPAAAGRVAVTHFPGRGLLIPAAVFGRIGLFDGAHFPQTAADYDFTHRARRTGFRIYCDPAAVLRVYPGESGDAAYRRHKGWKNYYRHLFDIKGGGNLRVFFWYAVRNCPWALLPVCLPVGLARRAGGYLCEWAAETLAAWAPRRRAG